MGRKIRISANYWPWGRTSPRQRISDIRKMIARNEAQILIVQDQAAEAVRRIQLNNEALEEQARIASGFIAEELRQENKKIAYELLEYGVNKLDEVEQHQDQEALAKQLRHLLEEIKKTGGPDEGIVDDFLDSMET